MDKTFVVAINFYSEPNYQGNCTKYYVKSNSTPTSYAGIASAKHYLHRTHAEKCAERWQKMYPTAKVEVEERTFIQRLNKQ